MSTYAQPADLLAYSELPAVQALSNQAADAELQRAEVDLDNNLFPPVSQLTSANRKIDMTMLDAEQTLALNRATCAQAEYRVLMGPEFFIRAQFLKATGPGGFTQEGRLPIIGPKTKRELGGSGLLPVGAQASPQRGFSIR